MTRTVFITGFEPFGGESVNASWEAVRLLPDELSCWKILKEQLPVIYGLAGSRMLQAAESADPGIIICTGVAAGRKEITPEMIAVNLRYAQIADNSGFQPFFERIDPTGPDGIFSSLPVREMSESVRQSGIPSSVSFTAGTYVCNDLFYLLMRRCRNNILRGFIHVPPVGVLDPETCSKGLSLCILTAIQHAESKKREKSANAASPD